MKGAKKRGETPQIGDSFTTLAIFGFPGVYHDKLGRRNRRIEAIQRQEATDTLLVLAAGAHAICRGTDVAQDWAQAIEEDTWLDICRWP